MYKFALPFLAAAAVALAGTASAQEDTPFALDWKFEGPSAPYFAAIDNGHFEAAGLNVEISAGQGSLDAIPKVATGAFPIGFADINSLVKFLDQNPGAPVIAVMMIYDKPPFAIVGRKSLGVMVPKDLEGRVLGAPPPDGAWAQFPAFATANDLDVDKITVEPVGFPTREPMLAEGHVAAVTGFFLLVLPESRPPRRTGGGHFDHTDGGLRSRALRERDHRKHRLCGRQRRQGDRFHHRGGEGVEGCHRRSGEGHRVAGEAEPRRRCGA